MTTRIITGPRIDKTKYISECLEHCREVAQDCPNGGHERQCKMLGAMPTMQSVADIQAVIACVAWGAAHGIVAIEVARFHLYAAQTALTAHGGTR